VLQRVPDLRHDESRRTHDRGDRGGRPEHRQARSTVFRQTLLAENVALEVREHALPAVGVHALDFLAGKMTGSAFVIDGGMTAR
jgi:hypothetical protein